MYLIVEIPEGTTVGDLITVRGSLMDAATNYIDWERLHGHEANTIAAPGVVLMNIADGLRKHEDLRGTTIRRYCTECSYREDEHIDILTADAQTIEFLKDGETAPKKHCRWCGGEAMSASVVAA